MSAELMQTLREKLGSRARFQAPMSARTTWGVGGPAWAVCRVHSAREAQFVISAAEEASMPWMPLGRGSNLLVRDSGYSGVMLRLSGPLSELKVQGDRIIAGGGAGLPAAVRLAAEKGLAGLEWAAGIPATVGGAAAGNAGAHGRDMHRTAAEFDLLMPGGRVESRPSSDFLAGYRTGGFPQGSLVLGARLSLRRDDPDEAARRTEEVLAKRRASQPLETRTAGCVFKNPAGDYAGRLIEAAGCKGLKKGGAMVSPKHANFIENHLGARAEDVLALMEQVAVRVRRQSGIELEPEVEVVGNA